MAPKSVRPKKAGHKQILFDTDLLLRLVFENIDCAREQVQRSRDIVAHSKALIARVKVSLARARHLHRDMSGPGNPWIQ